MSKLSPNDKIEASYAHFRAAQLELAQVRAAERTARRELKTAIVDMGAYHFLKLDMTKIRRHYLSCPECGR